MIKWIKVSGSLWYKRICHKGVFFILDAPFALMSVRGTLGITQFHYIYLCESCIKHGILKTEKNL